ncbi:thiaminase II [Haloechinothrix sp. LS1_15]|uniref:thiaminase II n=1 Tax=Haloechinothrix sp. LS1_15 TaxID=2652248 RepID=UPI002946616B|nr:thiaminase II [Haloechinothrix sp. LS1_15]MDV6012337.1 thiaminase II [Haloechinothrix sp. LS1_15]
MDSQPTAKLSDQLRVDAAEIWEAQHNHPFVRGIGDGTLDKELFRFWIRQDYLFLIEYSRLLAIATARAPDLETMAQFANLVHETLHQEMSLHRSYCADLGIEPADLERERMAPTTRGYTDFMLRTATIGDFGELLAALLPCMWGFSEIGRALAERGLPADEGYARWIDMYASDEFTEFVEWLRALTDRVGDELPDSGKERMREVFRTSSTYELAFWEMAWTREDWPRLGR